MFIPETFAAPIDLSKSYAYGQYGTLADLINRLINPIIGIASLGVIFYLLWGVFRLITSGGDKEKVASATKSITTALIGLLLVLGVFVFVDLIPKLFRVDISIFRK